MGDVILFPQQDDAVISQPNNERAKASSPAKCPSRAFTIPGWILNQSNISAGDKFVYSYLLNLARHDNQNWLICRSKRDFAEDLRVSIYSISSSLLRLQSLKLLTKVGKNHLQFCVYRIHAPHNLDELKCSCMKLEDVSYLYDFIDFTN